MASSSNTKMTALVVAGAAAAATVLYYLLRSDSTEASQPVMKTRKAKGDEMTKEEVVEVLSEICNAQEKVKKVLKDITAELLVKKYTFNQTYSRFAATHPEDPMEKYGISTMQLDKQIDKYQDDPDVQSLIGRLMGEPSGLNHAGSKGKTTPHETVVAIHDFMLKELQAIAAEFQENPAKQTMETKIVIMAAQAFVAAKVEEKFNLNADDIEVAVLTGHDRLKDDQEFVRINVLMQSTMRQLMGPSFPYDDAMMGAE